MADRTTSRRLAVIPAETGAGDTALRLSGEVSRWLTHGSCQRVFDALETAGAEARAVGGSVRDALLGESVADVDIATTVQPDQVMAAATAAGLAVHPTGIDHGTVTVVSGGVPYEVTTLRRDVATDGRRATVAYTTDWAEDAARRDFTINALYCDRRGIVCDPTGEGLDDLAELRVRFIGDPEQRIREDYLRSLRFFRFFARFGDGPPDPPALQAIALLKDGLTTLSAERVRSEILKLLVARRVIAALQEMADAKVSDAVLPVPMRIPSLADLAAIENETGTPPEAIRRLAALAAPTETDARLLARTLKLSNDERRRLVSCAKGQTETGRPSRLEVLRLLYRLGREMTLNRLLCRWSALRHPGGDPEWHMRISEARTRTIPVLPYRGADLVARGVPPGPAVGEILREFESWWLEAGFPDDPTIVEAKISALIIAHKA